MSRIELNELKFMKEKQPKTNKQNNNNQQAKMRGKDWGKNSTRIFIPLLRLLPFPVQNQTRVSPAVCALCARKACEFTAPITLDTPNTITT